MKKNILYAQSGGVTPVINATACGVIERAREKRDSLGKVYAGKDGIIGILREELIDTSRESKTNIAALRHTPGGAFGSCRYKLKSIPPTPVPTLEKARAVAMEEGLSFVYIGNVPEHPAGHTYCSECKKMLIRRIGYNVKILGLNQGRCDHCGHLIPGIWDVPDKSM